MNRDEAHGVIVNILTNELEYQAAWSCSNIADDILDAIWSDLTDDAIDQALNVWCEEADTAYSARINNYLRPDGTPDRDALREADDEAERLNRDLMRRAIIAAHNFSADSAQPP